MRKKKLLEVDIFVNRDHEAAYALSRQHLDMVYKYMDLLQSHETGELDISQINDEINEMYDNDTIALAH